MAKRFITHFNEPHFAEGELILDNPLIPEGIKIFSYDPNNGNKIIGFKMGPGYWNDLEYIGADQQFSVSGDVTNPIGDAEGVLETKTPIEILELMLNPYLAATISSVQNNAQGTYKTNSVLEIGKSLSTVTLQLVIGNINNMNSITPISIDSNGDFDQGDYAYNGTIPLNKVITTSPSLPVTYNINVQVKDTKGNYSAAKTTKIEYAPQIFTGVLQSNENITATVLQNIAGKKTVISSAYKRSYSFSLAGYSVICIPSMLNPVNPTFKDVTDVNALGIYDMDYLGTFTINNGVTTYDYEVYISSYYQLVSSIVEIN